VAVRKDFNPNRNERTTLTDVGEEKSMRQSTRAFAFFLLISIGAASQSAQATKLTVNCDKQQPIRTALRLLATTNPQGPNTITVSGACKGNIVIQSMDRLTLIAKNGASITDRSNGTLAVVDIEDSRSVTLQGFTINGGGTGILCNTASVCYLTGNTIQRADGLGVGVFAGSHAFLESNVIQNSFFRGATVDGSQLFSSNDVFQGNAAQGIVVAAEAYFVATNSSFLNNAVGVEGATGTVSLIGGTITGSGGDGVILLGGATALFRGPTITGNGGNGVHLEDGSFAGFLAANITGNLSGTDVDCAPQFPITRFVARTGGVTNCVEPASSSKLRAAE
jgi:Right handed beta helix region